MSANDKTRFYWLKLKEDFFKGHKARIIKSMPNGSDYLLFYINLLCESVSHDGRLRFSETIPYSVDMLSAISDTNIDIVRSAVKVLKDMELIEIWDDGTLFMTEVQKMIGSETGNAQRKREYRQGVQNNTVGQVGDNVPKSIEYRYINKRKENITKEKKSNKTDFNSLITEYTNNQAMQEALKYYVEMRKGMKTAFTEHALKLNLNELSRLSNDDEEKIAIINQTISTGWKGFYKLKERRTYSKPLAVETEEPTAPVDLEALKEQQEQLLREFGRGEEIDGRKN